MPRLHHAPVLAALGLPPLLALALPAAAQESEAPGLGGITLTGIPVRAQPDDDYGYGEREPSFLDPFPDARRAGVYGRIAGLVVEQQEDGFLFEDGERSEVTFDRGYGFLAAMGHKFGDVPLSLEIEYAYRNITIDDAIASDGSRRPASGDLNLHTFSANILFDAPDLVSIFGVYAGAGVGIVASELAAESRSGDANLAVTSEDIFLQVMAGVTVSVSRQLQLYGGMRWGTAGSVEQDGGDLSVDAEVVSAEFGLRIFF